MPITRRHVFGLLAGAAAAVGVPSIWISNMKTYDGPVSDHFDGTRFFDPDGVPPKSLAEVLRWQFGTDRKRASWPDWVPNAHSDTPPPRFWSARRGRRGHRRALDLDQQHENL